MLRTVLRVVQQLLRELSRLKCPPRPSSLLLLLAVFRVSMVPQYCLELFARSHGSTGLLKLLITHTGCCCLAA